MGRRTHYTHMPIARGHFSVSWYCLICPSGRSVLAGGSGSTAAYASHDALRDAGVLLCFFGQFDLVCFAEREIKM